MKAATSYEELKALPYWVVVRTAQGKIRERGRYDNEGDWAEMASDVTVVWEDDDFPVAVLWSYAQEICPPVMLPPLGLGGITIPPHTVSPYTTSGSPSVMP